MKCTVNHAILVSRRFEHMYKLGVNCQAKTLSISVKSGLLFSRYVPKVSRLYSFHCTCIIIIKMG